MKCSLRHLVPLLSVLTVVPVFADSPAPNPIETTRTEHVDFAPGGTIRLNNASGNLEVEGWDQSQVEVTTVRSMGFDTEPARQSAHAIDSVQIVMGTPNSGELTISTTRARIHNRFTHALGFGRDPVVEYRIRAPRNTHLIIDHADGYISITGVTGSIEANDRRGDIVLMLPDLASYSINASTKAGIVTSDLTGSTHLKHLLGENFTHGETSLTRKLRLRMGFGGITIKELPPDSLPAVLAAEK